VTSTYICAPSMVGMYGHIYICVCRARGGRRSGVRGIEISSDQRNVSLWSGAQLWGSVPAPNVSPISTKTPTWSPDTTDEMTGAGPPITPRV